MTLSRCSRLVLRFRTSTCLTLLIAPNPLSIAIWTWSLLPLQQLAQAAPPRLPRAVSILVGPIFKPVTWLRNRETPTYLGWPLHKLMCLILLNLSILCPTNLEQLESLSLESLLFAKVKNTLQIPLKLLPMTEGSVFLGSLVRVPVIPWCSKL